MKQGKLITLLKKEAMIILATNLPLSADWFVAKRSKIKV